MKLLNITTRYFLILIFTMLLIWCAVFYFSLRWTIYKDVDEYLTYRQHEIQKTFRQNPELITEKILYHTDFKVEKLSKKEYEKFLHKYESGKFKDTGMHDELEDEEEPFRKMESVFTCNGKYYKLTIIASLLNSEELLATILIDILIFSILLFGLVFILNRVLLRKLWNPFYETISKVKQYKLDNDSRLELAPTNIIEFKELNNSVEELIQNNRKVYMSQKHFIENASHEMQTPLGIIQNKVYMLMEEPTLTNSQATIIDDITEHVERLSRLNKTLLLLSKIENKQFAENEPIQITQLIESCCEDFSDLIEFKKLNLILEKFASPVISMNVDLARILFSNIIKNAINHNINIGFITISIEINQVTISNSGKELSVSPETLFERFNKRTDNSHSTGLGLAIVKTICQLYGFHISYSYKESTHSLIIFF